MGINVDTTISLTFLLGGMLAGAAGLIYALYQTTIWYFQGFTAGLIAFTAAVMGGIGNLRGAVLGGLIIGFIQQISDNRIGRSEWTPAIVFAYLILIMVFGRPACSARRRGRRDERDSRQHPQVRRERSRKRLGAVAAVGRRRRSFPAVHRRRDPACRSSSTRAAASSTTATLALAYVVMALGPEHRRRLRRPARPRLRRVLRDRRVHDRLVRLRLLRRDQRREGRPHRRGRASRPTLPGIHLNFLLDPGRRGRSSRDRGHAHRPADAAPARRLHRDRDARLRRDHRPLRDQRRRSSRSAGQPLTAGRQGITPVDQIDLPVRGPVHVARPQTRGTGSRSRSWWSCCS